MKMHMRDEVKPEDLERLGAVVTTDGRTVSEVLAGALAPILPASEPPPRTGRALWMARSLGAEDGIAAPAKLTGRAAMMARMANGGKLPGEGGSR